MSNFYFDLLLLEMACVYILYSKSLSKYYVGSCLELKNRLDEHFTKKYIDSFTAKANDWFLFLSIINLEYRQARGIEQHIKNMKSKKYIEDLKKYPELRKKLIDKY